MHMVIRAIVYAPDVETAKQRSRKIFEQLTEDGRPFDYYTMFDEFGTGVSGPDRWGDLPAVCLADSEEGKKLIQEGMEATRKEFLRCLADVRRALGYFSDEDLFEENALELEGVKSLWSDAGMVKHFFGCLGQYSGSQIWLYDADGAGIRTSKHLADVLSKWSTLHEDRNKSNPHADDLVWVVPADVHY